MKDCPSCEVEPERGLPASYALSPTARDVPVPLESGVSFVLLEGKGMGLPFRTDEWSEPLRPRDRSGTELDMVSYLNINNTQYMILS